MRTNNLGEPVDQFGEVLPPAFQGQFAGQPVLDSQEEGRRIREEQRKEKIARARSVVEVSRVEAANYEATRAAYDQTMLLDPYEHALAEVRSLLAPILGLESDDKFSALDRAGALKALALMLKQGAAIARREYQPPQRFAPIEYTHEPRTEGVAIYDRRKRDRFDSMTVDGRRLLIQAGWSFLGEVTDASAIDNLVATGLVSIHPANVPLPDMTEKPSPFAKEQAPTDEECRREALAQHGIEEEIDVAVAHAAKLMIERRKSAASK